MKNSVLTAVLTVLVTLCALSLSSSGAEAGTKAKMPVAGIVYVVPSVKGWQDSLPKGNDNRYTRDLMMQTHYVYEAGSDTAQTLVNQQRALHAALDDGWQILGFDEGRIYIGHTGRDVFKEGRK